jgi:hypothetical protein
LKAALDEASEVRLVVAGGVMRVEPTPGFGGDVEGLAAFLPQPCNQAFAVAVPVHVCGVEEVDTQVEGAVERAEAFLVVDLAPGAADGPAPHADHRNVEARSSQRSILHAVSLQRRISKSKRRRTSAKRPVWSESRTSLAPGSPGRYLAGRRTLP